MTRKPIILILITALLMLPLSACGNYDGSSVISDGSADAGSSYIVVIEDEPETADFQCTTIDYTVAINVFDRLVEMGPSVYGTVTVMPSLAESWTVSQDGLTYRFHLREGVKFSNGNLLTSSDVLYTFKRLITHPQSCNRDIAKLIAGSDALETGRTQELSGFRIIDDYNFEIELKEPFQAFLPCLSMPGASILDADATIAARDRFGHDPSATIGTGPYIFSEWEPNVGMKFTANHDCWSGAPKNEGIDLRFNSEPEDVRSMYKTGVLDILDLDDAGAYAEYFRRGDIYQEDLVTVRRIATTYIALNESIEPLDDVNVRKALQLALNRPLILDAVYGGAGIIVDGMYPEGMIGFNPDLPSIPYDPDEAKALLEKAGYPDGFDLTITVNAYATGNDMNTMRLAAYMWEKIGVRCSIKVVSQQEFLSQRESGKIACYIASWTADYDDPDTFMYTFFGSRNNTRFRSLCYYKNDVIKRVQDARAIMNRNERLAEYRDLEKLIIQDDAAWIPLFSRDHNYLTSDRIKGLHAAWNGSVKALYRDLYIVDEQ